MLYPLFNKYGNKVFRMTEKKPINSVAIGVGALCVVLLIALAYSYVTYLFA